MDKKIDKNQPTLFLSPLHQLHVDEEKPITNDIAEDNPTPPSVAHVVDASCTHNIPLETTKAAAVSCSDIPEYNFAAELSLLDKIQHGNEPHVFFFFLDFFVAVVIFHECM